MMSAHIQQFSLPSALNDLDRSGNTRLPTPNLIAPAQPNTKKRFWPNRKPKSSEVVVSLEEAARHELAFDAQKTPVSILQELLTRRGSAPVYELVQIEGALHEPTFRYRVTVNDYVALGSGRSKKEAKHAAAKNVLDKIAGKPLSDEHVIAAEANALATAPPAENMPGNPIGALQELCVYRRWPPPLYVLHCDDGLPHERNFIITCVVRKYEETGVGKAKKTAKRIAAQLMLDFLMSSNATAEEEPPEARYAGLKITQILPLTAPNTHKVAAFHKGLKTRRGVELDKLQELAFDAQKTPVSILQELLTRRGSAPVYELVQIEGAVHEPTFRYRVTVNDYVALGFGRSKKEAKHAAAKNVLDKIAGKPLSDERVIAAEANPLATAPPAENMPGNPIGALQELCMYRRWPPPLYVLNCEDGLPHERNFSITCVVSKYEETGVGKAKKTAKRIAAQLMLDFLMSSNATAEEEPPEARYAGLKTTQIPPLTAPNTHKVAAFHKGLKTRRGVELDKLQTENLNQPGYNYVQFLQELAQEQHFEVTYVDIEENSKTGKFQCLVQISTMPVAVCYGTGATSKDAQAAAAFNALEYLKIMTRK